MRCLRDALLVVAIWAAGGNARAEPGDGGRAPNWAPRQRTILTLDQDEDKALAALEDRKRAKLSWRWSRFRPGDYVATGLAAGTAIGAFVVGPSPGRWRGGVGFDEDVRDAMRLGSYHQRRGARDASDVLLAATTSFPLLVDSLVLSNWYYQSPDVAEQLFLISTETMAITAAVQGVVATSVSRERPYGRDCGRGLDQDSRDCRRDNRHRSFFSGHTSLAFAGASLVCVHRAYLPLSGGGSADALTCGSAYLAAAATGALRIASDVHYTSDVLVGAVWGSLAGLGLPWFLHYRHGEKPLQRSFHLVPFPGGVAVGGRF